MVRQLGGGHVADKGERLEGLADPKVQSGATGIAHVVVDRLPHERVRKAEPVGPGRLPGYDAARDRLSQELQHSAGVAPRPLHGDKRELPTDDSRQRQRLACC